MTKCDGSLIELLEAQKIGDPEKPDYNVVFNGAIDVCINIMNQYDADTQAELKRIFNEGDASTRNDEGFVDNGCGKSREEPPQSLNSSANSSETLDNKTHMTIEWEKYRDGWAKHGVDVSKEQHAFLHGYMAVPKLEPVSGNLELPYGKNEAYKRLCKHIVPIAELIGAARSAKLSEGSFYPLTEEWADSLIKRAENAKKHLDLIMEMFDVE